MKEYEKLGHMTRAPTLHGADYPSESGSGNYEIQDRLSEQIYAHLPYYLPHHGVLRENKITTKLRVVFNGSSLTTSGKSLNDIQYIGAKIQRDISDVLMWIRQYKFIFSTDITKMYRQINVHKHDWDLQRIIWIDDQLNMIPYQLTTVTYGTRSAPFLAIRSLLQLVEDEGHRFPLAIHSLKADM